MIKNFLYSFFHSALRIYYREFHGFSIIGPLKGNQLTEKKYKKILELREQRFKHIAPYLLDDPEDKVDLSENCDHFLCYQEGNLLGAVRFTSFPFEFGTELNGLLQSEISQNKYKEISRLVTRGKSKISKSLLTFSALHYIKESLHEGFIAICREEKVSLFTKFGMRIYKKKINISSRNDYNYHIIKASFEQLSLAHLKFIFKNKMKIEYFKTGNTLARVKNETSN